MQFPTATVEECDFDRQYYIYIFSFDEYVAISHTTITTRFKKSIIEKLNNCSFVPCKNRIVSPRLSDERQPVEFPLRFFRHPV